jgi:hypothetical protein
MQRNWRESSSESSQVGVLTAARNERQAFDARLVVYSSDMYYGIAGQTIASTFPFWFETLSIFRRPWTKSMGSLLRSLRHHQSESLARDRLSARISSCE